MSSYKNNKKQIVKPGAIKLTLPYNYEPRQYQLPVLQALDSGIKRAVCVWHRRAGKDKTFLNYMIRCMYERIGIYYYFFPTYNQGKKILWDGIDKEGKPLLDHFPEPLISSKNATEMKITLQNGSLFQVVGTDNYDSIVGTNPIGFVFSEFALQDPMAWGYIRPILAENGGWAIFPYTPRGFTHGYDIYQMAQMNPNWYCELLTIIDTGAITEAQVEEERNSGMSESLIQQEFYCSFEHTEGMAFRDIKRDIHMIDVSNPPDRLLRVFNFEKMTPMEDMHTFRSLDWGYARPFSVGWYFSDYEGRLYRFKELYGCKAPNEGIQMPARELAGRIKEIESEFPKRVVLSIADASIWDKPSNQNEKAEKLPSIAETFEEEGIYFDREISINAKKSRIQGKHQLHERLRVDADGLPSFQVFSTCTHWWRTVPVLPTDPLNPEDVDTDAEDHAYDETRYMLSARPFKSTVPKAEAKLWTFDWYEKRIEEREREQYARR